MRVDATDHRPGAWSLRLSISVERVYARAGFRKVAFLAPRCDVAQYDGFTERGVGSREGPMPPFFDGVVPADSR